MPLSLELSADRVLVPAHAASERFLVARVHAPPAAAGDTARGRAPLDVAFVIDRSGSMRGEKIHLARRAVSDALGRLSPMDRFAIVAFDDHVDTVFPLTAAEGTVLQDAREALLGVDARGSTNLLGGWAAGAAAALPDGPPRDAARRVIVLTDGQVNAGETRPEVIVSTVGDAALQGASAVTTACLGLGEDFHEVLLAEMASRGRGGFVFVGGAEAIPAAMAQQVGDVLDVVARAPELRITVPEGVRLEVLASMPVTIEGRTSRVRLPDLTADQELDVVLALHVDAGVTAVDIAIELVSEGHDPCAARHVLAAATDAALAAEAPDTAVLDSAARRIAAAARQGAVRAQDARNYGMAADLVRDAAARIGRLRPLTPTLERLAEELGEQAHAFGRPMESHLRKSHMHLASSEMTDRTFEGTSRKRRP